MKVFRAESTTFGRPGRVRINLPSHAGWRIWTAMTLLGLLMAAILFPRLTQAAGPELGAGPEISFYHWRMVYDPGPESLKRLEQLKVKRLYLRFFEVTVDDDGRPIPQATAVFKQKVNLPAAPVIFMENRVFSFKPDAKELNAKLLKRIMDIAEVNSVELAPELHLDCDWTPSTRAAFFEFAENLKARLPDGWELVVTIRLDQFKNYRTTGIPPADRVVLMAYNMGDIKRPGPGNSIIDPQVAARYIPSSASYPLPSDLALPIFSWVVVFDEHDRYQGLLSPVPTQLSSLDNCLPVGRNLYTIISPFQTAGGWLIPKGWRLRLEDSPHRDVLAVAELLRKALANPRHLIFYHLDDSVIQNRTKEELEEIADRLTTHDIDMLEQ